MKFENDDALNPGTLEKSRLLSLIEFSQQSSRLRGKPVSNVSAHGLFTLYEHEIQGLPGISLNISGPDNEEEIWLAVERLHETKPPEIGSAHLRAWVQMTQIPTEEPLLRKTTDGAGLIEAGTHCSSREPTKDGKPAIDPEATVALSEFEDADMVRAQYVNWLATKWRPWAEGEIPRRRSIRLYSDLFTLKQQLEGSIVEAQLEFVWGVGLGIWNTMGAHLSYPLMGRLVELALNPVTAEMEIRPRDVDARIETEWYDSVNNPGLADLEKAAKVFFGQATTTFSPFDRSTFEALLRSAATSLDANGIYWPTEVPAEDRTLPKADEQLKVSDTWLLFARPRTNSLFLQDLEKLKNQTEEAEDYPPAVIALVTDPDTTNTVVELPLFRGISAASHPSSTLTATKPRDLYFPKPFNDEQVRIVQLLEVHDGVVVQGPPGTGKTHTIANVICHYLAEGKRVLVTSMKDPALAVLHEQLPEEIRPLAISLLSSEQAGMKQFEHAIHKIASEIQSLDRDSTARGIANLAESIDALHAKLAGIDFNIGEWAKRNLSKVSLGSDEIDPENAAREVVGNIGQFEWISDSLGIAAEFDPRFSDTDIVRLREARRALGQDIDYLEASLPQLVEFPAAKELLAVHQDLSRFEKLKHDVDSGVVPDLSDSGQETIVLAQGILTQIETLRGLRNEVVEANRPWTGGMRDRLRCSGGGRLLPMLEDLGAELEQAVKMRDDFLERPVSASPGIELDSELTNAVRNRSEGRVPFGLKGLFGKSEQKRRLEEIRVLGLPPDNDHGWKHVSNYLDLSKKLRQLAIRWNAIANELQLEAVPEDELEGAVIAAHEYAHYLKVKRMVKDEAPLIPAATHLFPGWAHAREVVDNNQRLDELEKALWHHITRNRLATVWATKEGFLKVLEGRTGSIIEGIRRFLSETLGNPKIEDSRMQAEWSALMAELSRVLGLRGHLVVLQDVCDKVKDSGAPRFAKALKLALEGSVDVLLPDNWREAWRLRRLATWLDSIDAQETLKRLAKDRHEVENDLSRAYRDIVMKRTWLKLAENASPSIRAALQGYLNAIQKIGKGTGKRAVRYRQDARMAAAQANPAVPCWIMPHYRVSESLPAELGCFDLVIIDEASQSDMTALPALLRAQKVLIVGDDKQVSPEGVGLEENKIRNLMGRFLGNQVDSYRPQMSPERSIYDLYKVVFATSSVMLKEHFRCVGPIIEYSKREFYNHELQPLRVPRVSERLDPPLIDVLVEHGYRIGDVNKPEVRYIVDEIKAIVADPAMAGRSIGVVSLLGDKQPREVWNRLNDELGSEIITRHRIACGDARTFQGKERDIIFLSMVSAPNEVGAPPSRDTFAQRFNVAASRARDRMYLVRSVDVKQLSGVDRLRRSLIDHFSKPFAQDETRSEDLRKLCESPFEREMYDELIQRGYRVIPQVRVGQYRIDMVVEGHHDARLAVECDGDRFHGPDKWADDMQRQRVLERVGWVFWRCFASAFIRRRKEVLDDLLKTLSERGIEPIGAENASTSVYTEHRTVSFVDESASQVEIIPAEYSDHDPSSIGEAKPNPSSSGSSILPYAKSRLLQKAYDGDIGDRRVGTVPLLRDLDSGLKFEEYSVYSGQHGPDPRGVPLGIVTEGIVRIVETEGPVVAKRVYDIYLRGCGIKRMGPDLKNTMNSALEQAIRKGILVSENEANQSDHSDWVFSTVRIAGSPPIKVRTRGQRDFDEIPPSELQIVAKYILERHGLISGSDEHLRAVLECFELRRLTTQVGTTLLDILEREIPHVDDFLKQIP